MLSELGKRLDEHSENFHKARKKVKNTLERIKSRLSDSAEYISDLEDRMTKSPNQNYTIAF